MTLTPEVRAELRAKAKRATPGPWFVAKGDGRLAAPSANLRRALDLAANRLHRCAIDHPPGTRKFIEGCEWADAARMPTIAWAIFLVTVATMSALRPEDAAMLLRGIGG